MTLLVKDLPTLRVPTALDHRQRTGARPMLVLALVLRPGEFDGNVDHVIPRVVDADEPGYDIDHVYASHYDREELTVFKSYLVPPA